MLQLHRDLIQTFAFIGAAIEQTAPSPLFGRGAQQDRFLPKRAFPRGERDVLAFQMRKSALSIPSNIAEGHGQTQPTYIHHLVIAIGSHSELRTQADISFRQKFIVGNDQAQVERLLSEVGRITQGLLSAIRASRPDP